MTSQLAGDGADTGATNVTARNVGAAAAAAATGEADKVPDARTRDGDASPVEVRVVVPTPRQPKPVTQRIPRLEALTGLRWFAAFGVFLFHVRDFYPLPGMRDVAVFGNSGVTFFFVLSGFVLTWSFVPRDTAPRFYWRRFARIWPALAVSTALAIPVFYGGRGLPFDGTQLLGVLASLALVQAWIPAVLFAGNPAAWSLSDEAFFYALFPAVVRPLLRTPLRGLAALAATAGLVNGAVRWWAWGVPLSQHQALLLFVSPIGRLAEFLLGMVVAVVIRRRRRFPVPVWTAVLAVVAGLSALWYCRTHSQPYLPGLRAEEAMNQVMAPLYALLIAAAAGRDLRGRWMVLRSRPLVVLGRWSYSFYLVHATVLYLLVEHWRGKQPPSWDNWRPAAVALGAGLLASVALYASVEHPAEKFLRRLLRRRGLLQSTKPQKKAVASQPSAS